MRAWIIKWSWLGDHAAVETPIVTVLSARRGAREVKLLVERIYAIENYSLSEKLDQARYNNPVPNPYPAEFESNWQGAIICGHNPFLEAFLATNVEVIVDANGEETINYDRVPRPIDIR